MPGWSQATHSECCFGLSAWQFRLACHLKPISWTFPMWTDLTPDLNPCDYFLWGFLKKTIFSEKAANNNGIESTNHSGLQRDNLGYVPRSNQHHSAEEVARHNGGHTEHLIHRG
jgi:hypothetical protein